MYATEQHSQSECRRPKVLNKDKVIYVIREIIKSSSTIAGNTGERMPSENELAAARSQGE